jgi:hypothetical protein
MLVLQLLLTYSPPLNAAFGTTPIGWTEWRNIGLFALASSLLIAFEKFLTNAPARRRS